MAQLYKTTGEIVEINPQNTKFSNKELEEVFKDYCIYVCNLYGVTLFEESDAFLKRKPLNEEVMYSYRLSLKDEDGIILPHTNDEPVRPLYGDILVCPFEQLEEWAI